MKNLKFVKDSEVQLWTKIFKKNGQYGRLYISNGIWSADNHFEICILPENDIVPADVNYFTDSYFRQKTVRVFRYIQTGRLIDSQYWTSPQPEYGFAWVLRGKWEKDFYEILKIKKREYFAAEKARIKAEKIEACEAETKLIETIKY